MRLPQYNTSRYLPVTTLSLSVVLAVAAQLMQPRLWAEWVYMALCGMGLLLLPGSLYRRWHWGPCLAGAALLAFGSTGWRASHYARHGILSADLQRTDLVVTGRIVGLPQWQPNGTRFTLAVHSAVLDGQPVPLPDHIALAWYTTYRQRNDDRADSNSTPSPSSNAAAPAQRCSACLHPGELWRFTVRLKQPHGNRNPFGFDYERWLWEQGLGATGYVRTGAKHAQPRQIGSAHPLDVRVWRDMLRLQAREAVYRELASNPTPVAADAVDSQVDGLPNNAGTHNPQRIAGVIAALLMGDQRAIGQADWDIFRITGIAHLISISGLHITLFAWLAGALVGTAWRFSARMRWPLCLWLPAPLAALWGGMLLAAAYAWFSGWGIPAQRTSIMLLVVALLRTRGLHWPWWAVLATAAAVVTLVDPWALLQPGFWLSFVAVAVLFANSRPQAAGDHWRHKLLSGICAFARTQLTITLVLAPLTLLLFGQVSVVGFIANALAVPLVTFVVTPLTFLGVLWPALWQMAAWLLQVLMTLLQYLSTLPWASYQTAMPPLIVGAISLLGGLALVLRLPWPWRLAGSLALLPVLLWQAPRPAQGQFDLLAADIGQGNAILVRTHRHSLLFDAGPQYGTQSNAGQRVLLPLLAALDERPDRLVLSHQDSDHIGGAAALLQAYPRMQAQGSIAPEHPLQQLRPIAPCVAGQEWQWDGVTFSFLHPTPAARAGSRSNNAMSCVLRISNGQRTALLPGDIGAAQERMLIARHANDTPETLQADVLLVAHHGSKTSTTDAWLNAVQPRHALIQQGYLNPYGHPHATVLARLHERPIEVRLSESCGAAWWRSNTNTVRCERDINRHYWQHQHRPVAAVQAHEGINAR